MWEQQRHRSGTGFGDECSGAGRGPPGLRAHHPAALPSFVAGLKQGWAFVWRSLMAGELLVVIAKKPSVGTRLSFEKDLNDTKGVIAWMIIILVIGVVIDSVCFGTAERRIRERRGLAAP